MNADTPAAYLLAALLQVAGALCLFLWLGCGTVLAAELGVSPVECRYVGEAYELQLLPTGELRYMVGRQERTEVLRLRLAGSISSFDPQTYAWADDIPGEIPQAIRRVEGQVGTEIWEVDLPADNQPWAAKQARVSLYPDHWELRYKVTAPADTTVTIQKVAYGGVRVPDGDPGETEGSTFASRQIYTWTSDVGQQYLTTLSNMVIELQSSITPATVTQKPVNDMARFLIPPYLAAFEAARNGPWWGVGTLEVPQGATGLEVHISGRKLYFATSPLGAVRVTAGATWTTPALGFYTDSGAGGVKPTAAGVLVAYRDHLSATGAISRRSGGKEPTWWFEPVYTTWGDQVYFSRVAVGDDHLCWSYVNEQQIDTWIAELEGRGIPVKTVILDAGWALGSPEWMVDEQKWPDLAEWIERQHAVGRRVLLWMAPYWGSKNYGEPFPGFYLRDMYGGYVQAASFPAPLLDFSHPKVRAWFTERLRYLLSAEPGAIHADGLKIDFYYDRPDPRTRPFDPNWGMGEQYSLKTLEWIYATAKAANPEALITMSAANPFFNGSNDLVRVNDNWAGENAFAVWKTRAAAVINAGGNVMDSDDWIGYLQSSGESWTQITAVRAVLSVPSILTSKYREYRGRYVEPSQAEWNEAAALLQAYRLVPTTYSSQFDTDRPDGTYRRYTGGTGLLEAVTLQGNRGAVFYSRVKEDAVADSWDAYVVVLGRDSQIVEVPLQKGTFVDAVYSLRLSLPQPGANLTDGTIDAQATDTHVPFESNTKGVVRFTANSSGAGTIYRIRMVSLQPTTNF